MADRSMFTLGGVTMLTGFLVVTSVVTGRAERARQEPRRAELIELIEERQRDVDTLDIAVEQLRADVSDAQVEVTEQNAAERQISARVSELAQRAGTVALRGPGLVVTLSPSDREPPSPEEAGAYQIHDSDVQLVVNALFAAGAEAVAINGSRLVATTPIRAAGDTIVVNFRPLSPPFEIEAIGASHRAFERSDIARRFERWTGLFGLGFTLEDAEELTIPAYTGRVSISTATPSRSRGG